MSRKFNELIPGVYTVLGVVILAAQLMDSHKASIMFGGAFVAVLFAMMVSAIFDGRMKLLMAKTADECQTPDEAVIVCIVHIWILTHRGTPLDDLKRTQMVGQHCEHCKEPMCPLKSATGITEETATLQRRGYLSWLLQKCIGKFPLSIDLRILRVVLLLDCLKDGLVSWVTIRELLHSERLNLLETVHLLRYKYYSQPHHSVELSLTPNSLKPPTEART